VVSATFLSLMEAITPGGAFALYGVVCVLGYLFCYFVRDLSRGHMALRSCHLDKCQPETAYLTMEQTFELFTE
jgi:SP family myo-inositol transporter-like MFS transporter 13